MAVIATGFFDGVHKGHQEVIKTLASFAHSKGEEAIVITFDKHPRAVLQQDARRLRLLSSTDEKIDLLKSFGADRVELLDFSKNFSAMTAEQYLCDVLIGRYGAKALVLGYDNKLGSDKMNAESIAGLAQKLGLELTIVPASAFFAGEAVSSTKIRAALVDGRVEDAAAMLGYEYQLRGVVVGGKQYGRQLGYPTANMQLCDPRKICPSRGVYLTEVEILGSRFYGMTNVGDIIETHILDFEDDIYGLDICVQYKKRLRDMRRFVSGEDLKNQLLKDEMLCRELCADLPRL